MNIIIFKGKMFTNEISVGSVCVNPTNNKNYIVIGYDDMFNEWDVVDTRYGRKKSFRDGILITEYKK